MDLMVNPYLKTKPYTNMNPLKNLLFVVIVMFLLVSCGKNGNPGPAKNTKTSVYVAGNVTIHGISVAVYWKDGVKVALVDTTASISSYLSSANAIAVNGTDVYIAGAVNFAATYWKNGQAVTLPGGLGSYANAIAISGTDVYVAGYTLNGPVYWKNGVAVTLSTGTGGFFADAIAVSGNNVYVAGHAISLNGSSQVVSWNNGVFNAIGVSNSAAPSYYANINYEGWVSIAVSGSNVYIGGSAGPGFTATYWKNGTAVTLGTAANPGSGLNNILINGSDVYTVGFAGQSAVYWKNGSLNTLSGGTHTPYTASGIAISGSDIYISGFAGYPGSQAIYWKNNTLTTLEKGPSFTTGIAIVSY